MKPLFVYINLTLFFFKLNAQLISTTDRYLHYDEKGKFGVNSIYKSYKDNHGNLWLATAKGIICFDGLVFKQIKPEAHIKVKQYEVNSIMRYTQDTLIFSWFLGNEVQLFLVDTKTKKVKVKEIKDLKIGGKIYSDSIYKNESNEKETISRSYIISKLIDAYKFSFDWNALYLRLKSDFIVIKNGKYKKIPLKDYNRTNEAVKSVNNVLIHLKRDGTIGIYDYTTNKVHYFKNELIKELYKNDEASWLNTYFMPDECSASIYFQKENDFYRLQIQNNFKYHFAKILSGTYLGDVYNICADTSINVITIATTNNGLYMNYPACFKNFNKQNMSSATENIYAGNVFPLSKDSIITHIGLLTDKQNIPINPRIKVGYKSSLFHKGNLYITFHDNQEYYFGKIRFNVRTNNFETSKICRIKNEAHAFDMKVINDSTIFFITYEDFYLVRKDSVIDYFKFKDKAEVLRAKIVDNETILLMLRDGTCKLFNFITKSLTEVKKYRSMKIADIIDFGKTRLLCTKNDGLFVERENQIRKINILNSNVQKGLISAFIDTNEYCWLLSPYGLYRVHMNDITKNFYNSDHPIAAQNYNEYFNLTSNFISSKCNPNFAQLDQYYFIPTFDGISRFHADSMPIQQINSNIFINEVQLKDKEISLSDLQNLPYDFKGLSIGVSVPYLGNPSNLVVQYQLQGFDSTWVYMPEDMTLRYSSLPSGTYQLAVRYPYFDTALKQSKWKVRLVPVEVKKAWYNTWWFYTLILLSMLALSFIFIRYRTYQIRKRNDELENAVESRTDELLNTIKDLEFAQIEMYKFSKLNENMTRSVLHDIASPLKFIEWVALKMKQKKEIIQDETLMNDLTLLEKSLLQVNTITQDMLTYFKLNKNQIQTEETMSKISDIIESAANIQMWIAKEKGLQFIIDLKHNKNEQLKLNAQLIEIILRNLIDNAVKYTNKGEVKIISEIDAQKGLILKVKDTGWGLDKETIQKMNEGVLPFEATQRSKNGFKIIFDLIKIVNGKLIVHSEKESGTQFELYFPSVI